MPLPAGILRETVTIQAPVGSRDQSGAPVQTWTTYATRRAEILAETYIEQPRKSQRNGTQYSVRMRYVKGLTAAMRLRWDSRGGKILGISSFLERGVFEEHELVCEEAVT